MPLAQQSKRFKQYLFKESTRPLYEPIILPSKSIIFEPEIIAVLSFWQYLYWLVVTIISCLKSSLKSIGGYNCWRTILLLFYISLGLLAIIIMLKIWTWKEYLFYDLLLRLLVSGVKLIILY